MLRSAPLTRSYKSKSAVFRKGIRHPQQDGAAGRRRLPGHNIYRGITVQKKSSIALLSAAMLAVGVLGGCATESSRSVQVAKVESASRPYVGTRTPIAVGKFDNRSAYMRGVFSDNVDRLGSQAKTILITHLQQTQRFNVLDRDNMAEIRQEADIKKTQQTLKGADYVITGDVVEFGRKEVGDKQLFGILGRGREQIAYAKVNLNVVNIATSEVVYSSGGAGEFALSNREVIGFGGTAGYDSTLNGKVLDLAMREAVNNLVAGIESGAWTPGK
ncbi:Putative lipoprotein/NMB1164 [Pandoraea nosoerga]|uniref:Lipoprotein/NMB1164 n=2 Tax=Pandoraea nosoerga TaxID=2508296 RepID=A0A5E4U4V4_9BURK|nr:Putative lipoprotein/NMB1164 [Pandoraea nosoerga]